MEMQDRFRYICFTALGSELHVSLDGSAGICGRIASYDATAKVLLVHSPRDSRDPSIDGESQERTAFLAKFKELKAIGVRPDCPFPIDAEIAANLKYNRRELLPWASGTTDVEHEPTSSNLNPVGWDQFKANEELFGLTTDFDENMYTTKINKDNPGYAVIEAKAALIAKEIEKSQGSAVGEHNLSDNTKYSDVWRQKDSVHDRPTMPTSKTDRLAFGRDIQQVTPSIHGPDVVFKQFRQFVNSEKERLERKRKDIVKRDKDVRLQDLRKFSKTFKLKTPVPPDLIPILTKDKVRQAEMVAKLRSATALDPAHRQGKFETMAEAGRKEIPSATQPHTSLSSRLKAIQVDKTRLQTAQTFGLRTATPRLPRAGIASNHQRTGEEFKPNPAALTFTPSLEQRFTMEKSRRAQPAVQSRRKRISPVFKPFKSKGSETKPYNTPPTWCHNSTVSFMKSSLFEEASKTLRYTTEGVQINYQSGKNFQDAEALQKFQNQFNQNNALHTGTGPVYDVALQHQHFANQMLGYGGRPNQGTTPTLSFIGQQHPPSFPVPIYPLYGSNSQQYPPLSVQSNYNRRMVQQLPIPGFSNTLYSVK